METTLKLKILNSIGQLYEKSKDSKLEAAFFKEIDHELSFLSDYFRITKSQAFFVAMVFALNYKGDTVDFNDFIKYFDCNPMKILEYSDDFSGLYALGILSKQKSRHRMDVAGANDQFVINKKITEAILQNQPMPDLRQQKASDVFEMLEKLYHIGQQRNDEEISTPELYAKALEIITANKHIPLVEKIETFNFSIKDVYLFYYLIWKTISGQEQTDIGLVLEAIYDNATERIKYMQKIISGDNELIKNNLIETIEASFFNNTEMKLTDHSNKLLCDCGINLFANKKKKGNVMSPENIPYRKLIFNETEMQQLMMLKDLMEETRFNETQKRLAERNLPKGITALLHGAPGTGKTEIVKQLAKETNRELMKIEISQSKSAWFGESEKIIKRIFTDYKTFANESERTPILLFNEADAIISKRKEPGSSNVAQTENAIQNILLEELENFEGILIATTNLVKNLDTAFERRFLFKIKFKKPDNAIRAMIWRSKLPHLSIDDCGLLAERFDFSGGEIENIVRKNEIHGIIHGESGTLERLMLFCSEETLNSPLTRIGFSMPE